MHSSPLFVGHATTWLKEGYRSSFPSMFIVTFNPGETEGDAASAGALQAGGAADAAGRGAAAPGVLGGRHEERSGAGARSKLHVCSLLDHP